MQTDQPGSLKEKFGGFGAAPSDQLWNTIDSKLNQKERKKRGAFWWWFTGVAAGLTFIFLVFRFGYEVGKRESQSSLMVNQDEKSQNQQNTENSEITSEENLSNQAELNKDLNKITEDKNENTVHHSESENQSHSYQQGESVNEEKKVIIVQPDVEVPHQRVELSGVSGDEKLVLMPESDITRLENVTDIPFELNNVAIEKQKSIGKWEIGLNAGTLSAINASNQKVFTDQNNFLATDNLPDENTIQGSGLESYNLQPEFSSTIRRPLFFELTAQRNFGRRWSIASGLQFNFISGVNNYLAGDLQSSRSRFFSIAIPLAVEFDLIKRRRFEFSWVAGLNYEFPMVQQITNTYYNASVSSQKSLSFCSGYMISAFTAPRFTFNLNENIALQLTPQLRYYFHQTINSEMPLLKRNLWGGISVGVKWKL